MNAKQGVEFCADLICEAKETLVSEEGIGSDVAPCVIAFDENAQCLGWAQMVEEAADRLDQYQRLAVVAGMMRAGWHAHGVAFVVEGYLLVGDSPEDDSTSLAKSFASGNENVFECISIVYGDATGAIRAVSLPYKQELGRKVTWLKEFVQVVEDGAGGSFIEVMRHLFDVVQMIPWPPGASPSRYMKAMATQMRDHGFLLVSEVPVSIEDFNFDSDWNL